MPSKRASANGRVDRAATDRSRASTPRGVKTLKVRLARATKFRDENRIPVRDRLGDGAKTTKSAVKDLRRTIERATTTGDAFAAFVEPCFQQRASAVVQTSNSNLGICSYWVDYKVKDGKLERFPHCFAPNQYVDEEQRMMDFELRYLEAPDRKAYVLACEVEEELAVTETIDFSKSTTTGTAKAPSTTKSCGERPLRIVGRKEPLPPPFQPSAMSV